MKKALIFDIDGTLIDSNDAHARTWKIAFEKYGKHVLFDEMKKVIGMGGDKIREKYLSAKENKEFGDELEEFRGNHFRKEYLPAIRPFPKVRELFQKLSENGFQIALATSANEEEIDEYKKIAEIEDLVSKETSADDVSDSKPDPDIFEEAFRKLKDAAKPEVLIIGDTPFDAVAAKRAEIEIYGVKSGGWSEERLKEEGCSEVFADIAEIYENFERIINSKISKISAL